jgi:hypothetical protein
MNWEGRSLLEKFGFNPPLQHRVLSYDGVLKLDLPQLYRGSRCGLSIEVAPLHMRLSDGPNLSVKLSGEHNIPRPVFFEAFDRLVGKASEKGFGPKELGFAICQSVPHEATISGICVRAEEKGSGYLACEVLNGVRHGDFTPDYKIMDRL